MLTCNHKHLPYLLLCQIFTSTVAALYFVSYTYSTDATDYMDSV